MRSLTLLLPQSRTGCGFLEGMPENPHQMGVSGILQKPETSD